MDWIRLDSTGRFNVCRSLSATSAQHAINRAALCSRHVRRTTPRARTATDRAPANCSQADHQSRVIALATQFQREGTGVLPAAWHLLRLPPSPGCAGRIRPTPAANGTAAPPRHKPSDAPPKISGTFARPAIQPRPKVKSLHAFVSSPSRDGARERFRLVAKFWCSCFHQKGQIAQNRNVPLIRRIWRGEAGNRVAQYWNSCW